MWYYASKYIWGIPYDRFNLCAFKRIASIPIYWLLYQHFYFSTCYFTPEVVFCFRNVLYKTYGSVKHFRNWRDDSWCKILSSGLNWISTSYKLDSWLKCVFESSLAHKFFFINYMVDGDFLKIYGRFWCSMKSCMFAKLQERIFEHTQVTKCQNHSFPRPNNFNHSWIPYIYYYLLQYY